MKLALATGLLVPTIHATAERSSRWDDRFTTIERKNHVLALLQGSTTESLQYQKKERGLYAKRRLALQSQRALRNSPGQWNSPAQECDPRSSDADTGILSCDEGCYCMPLLSGSQLGGVCTCSAPRAPNEAEENDLGQGNLDSALKNGPLRNISPTFALDKPLVQCDPTSTDVGILVCGEGEFCKKDETSTLGGFCVHTPYSSRRLYTLDDVVGFCDPSSGLHPGVCDCSALNTTTGDGTIYCVRDDFHLGLYFYGCDNVIVRNTYLTTIENAVVTEYRLCNEVQEPSYEKGCTTYYGDTIYESCTIELNGQTCNSCNKSGSFFVDFDCSNVVPEKVGTSPLQFSDALTECYTRPKGNSTCTTLCTEGYKIAEDRHDTNVSVPEMGEMSCGYLAYQEEYTLLPDAYCSTFMTAAQSVCCAQLEPTTPDDSEPGPDEDSTIPDDDDGAFAIVYRSSMAFMVSLAAATILLAATD